MKFKISFCFFSMRAYTLIGTYVLVVCSKFWKRICEIQRVVTTIILRIVQFQRNPFLLDISIIFGKKLEANRGIVDEINDDMKEILS